MEKTITEYSVHELISKRWSPRAFDSKMIKKEELLSIFEAARWAASSFNEQPWSFIVVTKNDMEMFDKLYFCISEFNKPWSYNAPVLILTLSKTSFDHNGKENTYAMYDLGQAVASLALQAVNYDIYIHQLAGFSKEKAKAQFDIPIGYEPASVIVMGYMGDKISLPKELLSKENAPRVRKSVSEFVKIF